MKRLIAAPLIAAGLACCIPLGEAEAHTPKVSDSCYGLVVSLTNYEGAPTNNRVSVVIDGVSEQFDFGGSFTRTFSWSPAMSHIWTVQVDPSEFDWSQSGSEGPCLTVTSSSTSTTSTTSAPTTTSPSSVPVSSSSSTTTSTTAAATSTSAPTTEAPSSTPQPSSPSASTWVPPTSAAVTSPSTSSSSTVVSVDVATPPQPPTPDPLPVTGRTSDNTVSAAIGVLAAGTVLAMGARRRLS